jgi:Flp pilus assembly protein TadD
MPKGKTGLFSHSTGIQAIRLSLSLALLGGVVAPLLLPQPVPAATLFSGISNISVTDDRRNKVKIEFHADMPFQYRIKVLDDNRIAIKLINAKVSGQLKGPKLNTSYTLLNLVPTKQVQQATLLNPFPGATEEDVIEEMQLHGPGIGLKNVEVIGATPVADVPSVAESQPTAVNTLALSNAPAPGDLIPRYGSQTPAWRSSASDADMSAPAVKTMRLSLQPTPDSAELARKKREETDQPDPKFNVPRRPSQEPAGLTTVKPPEATAPLEPVPARPQPASNKTQVSKPAVQQSARFEKRTGFSTRQPKVGPRGEREDMSTPSTDTPTIVSVDRVPSRSSAANPMPTIISPPSNEVQPPVTAPATAGRLRLNTAAGYAANIPMPANNGILQFPNPSYAGSPAPWNNAQPTAPAKVYHKPLPRYRGGAPPISFTISSTGETVTLAPRGGEPEGPVAALAYAELPPTVRSSTTVRAQSQQLLNQARTLYKQQEYASALEALHKVVSLEPGNPAAYAALGEVYFKQRATQKAKDAYQQACRLAPDGAYHERYAVLLYQAGQTSEAITILQQLLQLQPNRAEAQLMLGTLFQEGGKHHLALPYLKAAARLNPSSPDIQFNLGLAYEMEGQRSLAAEHYQKALQLQPTTADRADLEKALRRVKS